MMWPIHYNFLFSLISTSLFPWILPYRLQIYTYRLYFKRSFSKTTFLYCHIFIIVRFLKWVINSLFPSYHSWIYSLCKVVCTLATYMKLSKQRALSISSLRTLMNGFQYWFPWGSWYFGTLLFLKLFPPLIPGFYSLLSPKPDFWLFFLKFLC